MSKPRVTTAVLRGDRCRCMACGALFTTTRGFDMHRVGKYPARVCVDPSSAGLVLNARGFWSRPASAGIYSRRNSTNGDLPSTATEVAI